MKKLKGLYALILILFLWGLAATFLYIRETHNPVVIPSNMVSEYSEALMQATEEEKVLFLTDFLSKYYTYTWDEFWFTQAKLNAFFSPELSGIKLTESERLAKKIRKQLHSQRGKVLSLQISEKGNYLALLEVISPNQKNSPPLYLNIELQLTPTPRSVANPRGLLIRRLKVLSASPQVPPFSPEIYISKSDALRIQIPCKLENIESPQRNDFTFQITHKENSEISLLATKDLPPQVEFILKCKEQEFAVNFISSIKKIDLFLVLPLSQGRKISKRKVGPDRSHDKKLEALLGVKIVN